MGAITAGDIAAAAAANVPHWRKGATANGKLCYDTTDPLSLAGWLVGWLAKLS